MTLTELHPVAAHAMADHAPLVVALGEILPGIHAPYRTHDSRGCAVVRADLPLDLQIEVTWVCHVEDQPEIEAMVGRGRGELLRATPAEIRTWLVEHARDLTDALGGAL